MARVSVNAMSFGILVQDLLHGTYTLDELAERTGLHRDTITKYTLGMYKAKAIHICCWRMDKRRRYVLRVYKIGDRQDVPRPREAPTAAQRSAKYREKLRLRRENNGQAVQSDSASRC